MTHELLQTAYKINREIIELETQYKIAEDMLHCDNKLTLEVDGIGAITLDGYDELKNDILNMVLNSLNNKKGNLEDQFRTL